MLVEGDSCRWKQESKTIADSSESSETMKVEANDKMAKTKTLMCGKTRCSDQQQSLIGASPCSKCSFWLHRMLDQRLIWCMDYERPRSYHISSPHLEWLEVHAFGIQLGSAHDRVRSTDSKDQTYSVGFENGKVMSSNQPFDAVFDPRLRLIKLSNYTVKYLPLPFSSIYVWSYSKAAISQFCDMVGASWHCSGCIKWHDNQ